MSNSHDRSLKLLRKLDVPGDDAFSEVGLFQTPRGRYAELAKVVTSTDNVVSMRPLPAEKLDWFMAKMDRAEERVRGKRSG